jgi:hypothetical protein
MLGIPGPAEIGQRNSMLPLAEMKREILNRAPAWSGGPATDDELHLRYAYTVGGKEYIGTRASFSAWGPTENLNPFNSAIAHRYPVGARVLAHYDPLDYSHSVLQPAARLSAWVAFLFGLLLAWLGLVYARRAEAEKKQLARVSEE